MKAIIYRPIGVIHTSFKDTAGVPIQPRAAKGIKGSIEILPEYAEGLQDLDGFSHIILLYHLHLHKGYSLKVIPFLDNTVRGLFATRAPKRPNPIGFSVVRLIEIKGNVLHIEEIDVVDGTPLLDIKPYVPEFDKRNKFKIGWLTDRVTDAKNKRADKRFTTT
ncbi:MAG: tRNA (N6-threonylcarbamoyladenosine(37)-N6)-methyltransferase TrmO [candidate division WOR-3 bacterium]|nr:MAG: tRNA (N6-threonylcarbamoyladenosine(37)-N6)-methyltransferase TrmO [candidate division WOR-3 bacterium]